MQQGNLKEFVDYVLDFYGVDGIYALNATRRQVVQATNKLMQNPDHDFAYDSFDREKVRDILIEDFGLKLENQ